MGVPTRVSTSDLQADAPTANVDSSEERRGWKLLQERVRKYSFDSSEGDDETPMGEKNITPAETSPTPVETDKHVTNGEAEGQLTVTAKPKWSPVFLGYACDQGPLRSTRCDSPRCPKIHRKGKRNGPKCDQCGGFRRCPLANPVSWAICPSNFHENGYYTPGHSNNQGAGFAGIFENALFG